MGGKASIDAVSNHGWATAQRRTTQPHRGGWATHLGAHTLHTTNLKQEQERVGVLGWWSLLYGQTSVSTGASQLGWEACNGGAVSSKGERYRDVSGTTRAQTQW